MKNKLQPIAKQLRKNQTPWENRVWFFLRDRRFADDKFRRQFPIDKYIVDFCCLEKRLIIELDGGWHNETKNLAEDKERDDHLKSQDFRILRIWNNELDQNPEGVKEKILELLKKTPSSDPRQARDSFSRPGRSENPI